MKTYDELKMNDAEYQYVLFYSDLAQVSKTYFLSDYWKEWSEVDGYLTKRQWEAFKIRHNRINKYHPVTKEREHEISQLVATSTYKL